MKSIRGKILRSRDFRGTRDREGYPSRAHQDVSFWVSREISRMLGVQGLVFHLIENKTAPSYCSPWRDFPGQ